MRATSQRVLALTLGEDGLASSRVRVAAALATMSANGWQTARVCATTWTWPLQFLARLILFKPAVTIIQKVVPPAWFSKIIATHSVRLVFECDDAIQLGYGTDVEGASDTSRRLAALLPLCDTVIVSNALLGRDLERLGASEPIVFPGPAPAIAQQSSGNRAGVLWLGSPSTIENVRTIVYPALELLPQTIELTVVGASRDREDGRIAERIWSKDLETKALGRARVGVAPQALDEWSSRKAFYKVLEYLAAAVVPVVPAHPAVTTLLGEELDIVAVTADDATPAAWAQAVAGAFNISIDRQWTAARDRVFARWSADRLGRLMLGDSARYAEGH